MALRIPRLLLTLAGAALAAGALAAQDVHFGLSAGLASPTGDLKTYTNNRIGLAAGAHAFIDLGNGQAIRPRLDVTSFGEKNGYYRLTQTSLAVDFLWYPDGGTQSGLYLDAGLGYASNRYASSTLDAIPATYGRTSGKPVISVGGGYQINASFGVELRYAASRFADEDGSVTSVNFLTLAATVRF